MILNLIALSCFDVSPYQAMWTHFKQKSVILGKLEKYEKPHIWTSQFSAEWSLSIVKPGAVAENVPATGISN